MKTGWVRRWLVQPIPVWVAILALVWSAILSEVLDVWLN